MFPTRFPAGDNSARPALLRAFCAARVLRSHIHREILQMLNRPSPPLQNRTLPSVRKVPRWPVGNGDLEFQILGVAFQDKRGPKHWNANRFLYTAKTLDTGRVVVVKFARQYCPELHSFCAEQGHAPKLLGYGAIPGEWKVVVMDYIDGGAEKVAEHISKHWPRWNHDLTRLVELFHDEELVHHDGDLREANFVSPLKEPEKVMLVDFDWGGESGKVSYPTWMLNPFLIEGMPTKSLRITKQNDIRVLEAAMQRLRYLGNPPNGEPMDVS